MMNPARSIKRIAARHLVDEAFKKADNHPLVKGEGDVYLDIFDTGIIVNIGKAVRKYYPQIVPLLKELARQEIKKL